MAYSGLVGLDLLSRFGGNIWYRWGSLHAQGAFRGPHFNQPSVGIVESGGKWSGWCSDDPRCEGHRHDESALSYVLHSLGLVPKSSGFLQMEGPEYVIGHMVPDYDVVRMLRMRFRPK